MVLEGYLVGILIILIIIYREMNFHLLKES